MKSHLIIVNLFISLLCTNNSFATRITDILCTNDTKIFPNRKLICDNNFTYETDQRYYSCYKKVFTEENGANNILYLETGDCRGSTLDPQIPNVFKNLVQYGIVLHGIESLSPDDLRFTQLKFFDASYNKLTFIPDALFVHAPLLESIDLSWNNILTVEAGAFSELKKLYILQLTNNPIVRFDGKIFLPIDFRVNTFSISWRNVEDIDISNMNGVYQFGFADSHNGLPRRLSLVKETRTTEVWSSIFRFVSKDDLKNVKIFNASNSAVRDVVKIIDILGSSLEVLDVSSNSIGKLNGSVFDRFTNLHHLNLSNTNLTSFDLDEFHNRNELKLLDISFNNLNKINFTPASGAFKNLETFNVIGNKLDNVNFTTQSDFPKLTNLGIEQNNLV